VKREAPPRTCVGCRQVRPQDELIRLTRDADGVARVDGRSKRAGRGVYACPTAECLTAALRKGRLDHAFRRPTRGPAESVGEILKWWSAKETSIGGTSEGY
jgi:predicted RNA-binding protein YlxR (DUF448 family)